MSASLLTDQDYLPAILARLDAAESAVDIIAFSFAIVRREGPAGPSGAAYQVAQKLAELKRRRGNKVRIRIFLENERDVSLRNRETARFLNEAGVEIRFGLTHAKALSVDGRHVFIGSTNLTNQSLTLNHEANVLLTDARVADSFANYFEHFWRGGRHGGAHVKLPLVADGAFKPALVEMIEAARERLEFSIYFFFQTAIENAFIAAHKRGVKIRGLIHRHEEFGVNFVKRTQTTVERMRRAGLRDLNYGRSDTFSHAKYLIRDRDEIMVGSGNWLDADVNRFPQLYARLADSALAERLARHLGRRIEDAAGGLFGAKI